MHISSHSAYMNKIPPLSIILQFTVSLHQTTLIQKLTTEQTISSLVMCQVLIIFGACGKAESQSSLKISELKSVRIGKRNLHLHEILIYNFCATSSDYQF